MNEETFHLNKHLKITCRKPTPVEIYIHSMLNLMYDGHQKFERPLSLTNNFYFRRNGYNNDV